MSRINLERITKDVSCECGIPKTWSKKIINSFLNRLTRAFAEGDWIVIRGFGTFTVYYRKGRMWKNPATLKDEYIKPSSTVRFKASKKLKRYY